MNRRSFFTKLALAAAAFTVLPSATTYARKWVAPRADSPLWIPNPAWETAEYRITFLVESSAFDVMAWPKGSSVPVSPTEIIRYEKRDGTFHRFTEISQVA